MSEFSTDPVSVIFDLDGTLVDSAPDIHAGVTALLQDMGVEPLPFEVVRGFIGGGVPVLIDRVMAARGLDAALRGDLIARFTAAYEHAPDGLTTAYPGVPDALRALTEAGLRLGLCTNKPTSPTRGLLAAFGWTELFDCLICGDTLAVRKPDPAPLQAAVAQMGGGAAVFVGDSEVDVATAQAAGVPLLLFTGGYRKTPVADLAHHAAFDHFDALAGFVAAVRPR